MQLAIQNRNWLQWKISISPFIPMLHSTYLAITYLKFPFKARIACELSFWQIFWISNSFIPSKSRVEKMRLLKSECIFFYQYPVAAIAIVLVIGLKHSRYCVFQNRNILCLLLERWCTFSGYFSAIFHQNHRHYWQIKCKDAFDSPSTSERLSSLSSAVKLWDFAFEFSYQWEIQIDTRSSFANANRTSIKINEKKNNLTSCANYSVWNWRNVNICVVSLENTPKKYTLKWLRNR